MRFPHRLADKEAGFTFPELLVVILIIIVLIGLLPFDFGPVTDKAKKAHAASDEQQIIMAIKAYYTEYGTYPVDMSGSNNTPGRAFYGASEPASLTGTATTLTNNNAYLFDILRNNASSTLLTSSGSNLVSALNPRKVDYMEIPSVKDPSAPASGVVPANSGTASGIFYDPWGSPYNVLIDGGKTNHLTNPYSDAPGGNPLKTGVISWSLGKNGQFGGDNKPLPAGFKSEGGTPNQYKGSGDVISWQ